VGLRKHYLYHHSTIQCGNSSNSLGFAKLYLFTSLISHLTFFLSSLLLRSETPPWRSRRSTSPILSSRWMVRFFNFLIFSRSDPISYFFFLSFISSSFSLFIFSSVLPFYVSSIYSLCDYCLNFFSRGVSCLVDVFPLTALQLDILLVICSVGHYTSLSLLENLTT